MKSSKPQTKKPKAKKTALAIGKNGKDSLYKIIERVRRNIIAGHSEEDIKETLVEEFSLNAKEVMFCFQTACNLVKREEPPQDFKRSLAKAAVKMLYQKMVEVGDYPGALAAMKEYSKLNQLYTQERKPRGEPQPEGRGVFIIEPHDSD